MKKRFQKMLTGIFLLALLVLMPVFSAYAEEYAKNVESVNGRSAIVQKVSGTTGTAEVIRNNSSFTPAKGVRLAEGDSLKTSGDYRVYIMVDSTMVLRVDENSEVVIKKAALGQKLSVQVKSGKMFYNVAMLFAGMTVSAIMPSFALPEIMPSFLNEEVEPAEAVEMEADDIPGEGQNGSSLSPERAGDRTLSASGFTKDIYSLETNHNGYYGMLRY